MFGLTQLVLGQTPFVEITEDEYSAGLRAKGCVWQALQVEEKFDIVLSNYEDFERDLLTIALRAAMYFENDWSAGVDTFQGVNRRIVNLLATCRLYLDQIGHNLSLMYGQASAPAEGVRAACHREYAARLGYRSMEALRNYVQHRGMPIHRMSLEGSWIDEGPKVRRHLRQTVGIYLEVDRLREDGKFKGAVLAELQGIGKEHNLKDLLRDYIAGIGCVHEDYRRLVGPDIVGWETTVLTLIERYRDAGGDIRGLGLVRKSGRAYDKTDHLIDDPITRRRWLSNKNHQTKHYPKVVVTDY